MAVSNSKKIISTNRFILKPLKVDDVTERYARWLSDQATSKYISARLSFEDLQKYVYDRTNKEDVLFLGIFDKITGLHIGNIKYEPINSKLRYAIMGILIGEAEWRGKGVATEVLLASAEWLCNNRNIQQIILSVSRSHTAAIKAYKKVGFVQRASECILNVSDENLTMVLDLKKE